MSIKASEWVELMAKRKVIYAHLQNPISVQEITDLTGYKYMTVINHIDYLTQLKIIKPSGIAKYGKINRDLYIALQPDYNPDMPNYVSQYLAKKESTLLIKINPHVMKVSSDDYHTRGNKIKRSAWIASSLQAF